MIVWLHICLAHAVDLVESNELVQSNSSVFGRAALSGSGTLNVIFSANLQRGSVVDWQYTVHLQIQAGFVRCAVGSTKRKHPVPLEIWHSAGTLVMHGKHTT